jgi:dihydropteroate synthase
MNQTLVMGILNVTPDSFADGGKYFSKQDAINQGRRLFAEGADIIDIGGESTRPGAERVSEDEEISRVIPVVLELVKDGAVVSVDTMRSAVAKEAVAAGAKYINDVSGGLADESMASVIAANPTIQYIVMHWRGHSKQMQKNAVYEDVVKEVKDELDYRVSDLINKGVGADQIILDPGIGFAKESSHNWKLLQNIERLQMLGYPLLVGVSRKRFLGELTNSQDPSDREFATIAITAELARQKVWGVRTHTVKAHKDAIAVIERLRK